MSLESLSVKKRLHKFLMAFAILTRQLFSTNRLRKAYAYGFLLFGQQPTKWFSVTELWELSDYLWRVGDYFKSVEIRRNILEEVVAHQSGRHPYSGPRVLSAGWASNIGHLGWLAMYAGAMRERLLPEGRRTLVVAPKVGNKEVLDALAHNFDLEEGRLSSGPREHLALLPFVELLNIVYDGTGFIDTYELWERYWQTRTKADHRVFHISDEYTSLCQRDLAKLGVPVNDPFVSLHIRTEEDPLDPRAAPLETFIPAVQHLIKSGFHVIQFGATRIDNLVDDQKYVNLTGPGAELTGLELFILERSQFFLTTQSGPATVASMLGTPVIHTNSTSIGRNLCSTSNGSIFLPKHHYKQGKRLSLNQILSSRQAYWEPASLVQIPIHSRPRPNTSSEIIAAVKEMIYAKTVTHQGEIVGNQMVNQIRQANGAIGYGRISESFLEENGNWFLK